MDYVICHYCFGAPLPEEGYAECPYCGGTGFEPVCEDEDEDEDEDEEKGE